MKERKTLLLVICFAALCLTAAPAMADMYELDRPTVLNFTKIKGIGTDDVVGPLSVYDGPDATYYAVMSGQVGFVASMEDSNGLYGDDLVATAEIFADDDAGLGGDTLYDGIKSYFQNDNDDHWAFQLFYEDSDGIHTSGDFVLLPGLHTSAWLTVVDPNGVGGLDLDDIIDIGFRVQGNLTSEGGNPSQKDSFHVSLVPVPGAVLLGILGLSVVGVKLRKYA